MTRKFKIEYTAWATIELEDDVIDTVDNVWRKELYDLRTSEDIAKMIGRNMIRGVALSDLDGWANQSDTNAKLIIDDDETVVEEIE